MKIWDRLHPESKPLTSVEQLPDSIELGRYYYDNGLDLTNRTINVGVEKRILQELLEEKNEGSMNLFHLFFEKVSNGNTNIVPLLQDITDKLRLNSFDEKLRKELWHIESICRQPHFLLNREVEKVNVARAKRISNRSYGYLSSHTEDWLQKSIVSFKPRKVLNEELDEFYDVYENRITVAFVLRCLRYLKSRIDELDKIVKLLQDKDVLLKDRNDENKWYKKIERNLDLIGRVYDDDSDASGKTIANETKGELLLMQNRLKAVTQSIIFAETSSSIVAKVMTEPIVQATNVTVNHKHYRYLRDLWKELNDFRREQTEEERKNNEQNVIQGIRDYAKVTLFYAIEECLGYKIKGYYNEWIADHDYYSRIALKEDSKSGIITLDIDGLEPLSVVTIGSELIECNISPYTLILSYQEDKDRHISHSNSANVISISPYDPDSVEWIAKYVRGLLMKQFYEPLYKNYSYEVGLGDYVCYIQNKGLFFNLDKLTYNFIKPLNVIDSVSVLSLMDEDPTFSKKNFQDRSRIKASVESFVKRINSNIELLQKRMLCADCWSAINNHRIENISYLQCNCGFVIDTTRELLEFINKDEKYHHLDEDDWGMDYVSIKIR